MNRRDFFRSLGVLGAAGMATSVFPGLVPPVLANVSARELANARAKVLDQIGYSRPTVMPQVLLVFLYGGPSELGGNLTNTEEINAMSLNKYPGRLLPDGGDVTANDLWRNAGGEFMENMLAKGRMSIYRTLNRVKDNSRAHRPSIFSNLTGMIGEDDSRPGIATNLAAILAANEIVTPESVFPFATFEGDSVVFNRGDLSIPLNLRPISLDAGLNNPYQRNVGDLVNGVEDRLDALVAKRAGNGQYAKVVEAFTKRAEIDVMVERLRDVRSNADLPPDPDAEDPTQLVTYPGNNGFADRLRAAVTLLIENPQTMFVSVGSQGIGGWDDHDDAIDKYQGRMTRLMSALDAATKHLEAAGKSNVAIMCFGDFGRNANLNGSMGWDHGNCQNLYTFSGSAIAGRRLGTIVGETTVYEGGSDRIYTKPTDSSYQAEPFAVASTIYKYFGVTNPEILTGEAPIDETVSSIYRPPA